MRIALLLLSASLLLSAAGGIGGTWATVMVDPPPGSGARPLVNYEPTLVFNADGDRLTGAAVMTGWPGSGAISDGKIDGDRISFTLTHQEPYRVNGVAHYPAFVCKGTIHGDELDLTMIATEGSNQTYRMKGTRAPR